MKNTSKDRKYFLMVKFIYIFIYYKLFLKDNNIKKAKYYAFLVINLRYYKRRNKIKFIRNTYKQ